MSTARIFISQFKSPLIYVLVAAAAVTGLIGDRVDALVISAAVILNTFLGFFQEYKAEKSLQALKKYLTPKAKAIRSGKRQIIEASTIVAGDVCILEVGERVPADGVLVEAENLSVNEAVLTGESVSVAKTKGSRVFMGTIIAGGIARMRVEAIGSVTKFGRIAASLKETREPETPLQKQLAIFSKKLTWILGAVCLGIFILGLIKGDGLVEIFTTSVAVAVGAIPEGLVIALTVVLSLGMQRILKRKALVRKLLAAETLGSVTVICCDKTGTLTEGKMKVVRVLTDDEPLLRKAAVLCNDQRDQLEGPMLEWGKEKYHGEEKRLGWLPFDHERKYIATLYPGLLLVSGAPEMLMAKCGIDKPSAEFISEAKKGRRLVGFAYKKTDKLEITGLRWLGALVYDDPVRQGVKDVLKLARERGIKVKLVTGDYRETAEAVAKALGIGPKDVYSRVDPQQKLKIVEELQAKGEVVAMTGDGVNDAPALKKADIGIVVADASAVATETADIVLLDSNFATILAAVEEGRLIFSNITKVLYYLMANAFAEVVVIAGSMLLNLPLPLTAAQILWINLINDSWPAFALTLETHGGSAMAGTNPKLFDRLTQINIGLISLLTGVIALILFAVYRSQSLPFTLVAVAPLIYAFAIGSVRNLWLILALIIGLGLQVLVLYSPALQSVFKTTGLSLTDWGIVVASSLIIALLIKLTNHDRR